MSKSVIFHQPWKSGAHLYVYKFSQCSKENILNPYYKVSKSILLTEIIILYCEPHETHKYTLWAKYSFMMLKEVQYTVTIVN